MGIFQSLLSHSLILLTVEIPGYQVRHYKCFNKSQIDCHEQII